MKPNRKLISALRNVAYKVSDNPQKWKWDEIESCNCGLLAQELGISYYQIFSLGIAYWGKLYENHICGETDIPMDKVLNTLLKNGIEPEDLDYLENEVGIYDSAFDLSDFFSELADKLEARLN